MIGHRLCAPNRRTTTSDRVESGSFWVAELDPISVQLRRSRTTLGDLGRKNQHVRRIVRTLQQELSENAERRSVVLSIAGMGSPAGFLRCEQARISRRSIRTRQSVPW